ncbi:MAG TPA: c-type cytochrome [Stenotrophobium sp.]|jgi:cytochrome c553|nr:c-type cytochrome [Stenotrophobium sp.]
MKRVLLILALSVPFAVFAAEQTAQDPFVKGDAAAGATKAAVCGACHGPTGNSTAPNFPKLAGQNSKYILEQLQNFKSGKRVNPIMQPQASALSDQDMQNLAVHFAAGTMSPGVASKDAVAIAEPIYRAGIAARGIPACAACHGPTGAGVPASGYPRIGGQHATYLASSLRRLHDMNAESLPDGNVKIMSSIAAKLSDKEMDALASYINGLQ